MLCHLWPWLGLSPLRASAANLWDGGNCPWWFLAAIRPQPRVQFFALDPHPLRGQSSHEFPAPKVANMETTEPVFGGSDGKESALNVEDPSSIPGSRRSPGEGNGNPLQYSCLEKPMDGGTWRTTIHGVAKNQTRLNDFT